MGSREFLLEFQHILGCKSLRTRSISTSCCLRKTKDIFKSEKLPVLQQLTCPTHRRRKRTEMSLNDLNPFCPEEELWLETKEGLNEMGCTCISVFDYGTPNTNKSRIYVFGCAVHGAIGLRNLIRPAHGRHKLMAFIQHPVRHKFFYDMDTEDICAGHGFSLFAVRRKNINSPAVFGCGLNESSQLGYQAARPDAPMERLIAPAGISLPISGERPKVLAMGAGRAHSVISVENEGLFTFGDNSEGQCGRPIGSGEDFLGSRFVHRISRFSGSEEIIELASRYHITICVTKSGRVYTCGENKKGQLGRGKDPRKAWDLTAQLGGDIGSEKIVKVATNGSSCLGISEKGELFGWGCNEIGLLSPDKKGSVLYEPRFVNVGSGIGRVKNVAIAEMATFVLNEKGDVFVWGQGPSLGLGSETVRVKGATLIPPPLFGRNEFSDHVKVVSVRAGFVHAAAINSLGDLFTWGLNNSGCLGLGLSHRSKAQHFPLKVCLNGTASKVSLGVDHTLVLCHGAL